jgi:hypothetical protein
MSNAFEKVKKVVIEFEDGSVAQSSLFGKDALTINALQEECKMYKSWLEWQPIATAPYDTKIFVLYHLGFMGTLVLDSGYDVPKTITHWLPIPPLPNGLNS